MKTNMRSLHVLALACALLAGCGDSDSSVEEAIKDASRSAKESQEAYKQLVEPQRDPNP